MEKRIVAICDDGREGILRHCPTANGLVIFAHGAGSSRLSPRNNHVAEELGSRGMATLLFDLLTETEATDRRNVFDIPRLAGRVIDAVHWARTDKNLSVLPIGLFGASTGAAAALVAASRAPDEVAAVVSRGGRPDLAGAALAQVRAPTLLIVGSDDRAVIELNEVAARQLHCRHQLVLVSGATHLFEEPGALDRVVDLAAGWFAENLRREAEE